LRPASDNAQFMQPVIVNRFPIPALNVFVLNSECMCTGCFTIVETKQLGTNPGF